MKKILFSIVNALALFGSLTVGFAQGTAFTYQGRLDSGGNPATGLYDFQFALFNAPGSGNQIGSTITNLGVGVTNGQFTTTLDFGAVLSGQSVWLAVSVRTNGTGSYVEMVPLQPLTPVPYAVFAGNAGISASASSVAAANITGTLPLTQLPSSVVTNGASGVALSGAFSGNGAGVTNVSFNTLNSGGLISWLGDFATIASPAVGNNPQSVVAADVNGDGKMDLISANSGANTLTILTNKGGGSFVLASSPSVGSTPFGVTATDVNGDGKVDLVSANSGANTLTVLTNNGSGGFVLASSPGVGISPYSVAAADVNGDGKMDLISANRGTNTLTVLTNNGSGGFVLASSPGVGGFPDSVAAADVNGDGKVDLVSANFFDGTLTVLTNNGSGGFVLSSTPVTGSVPMSVVAADVNGDGKVDLISAGALGGILSIWTNNGSGGFALASSPSVGGSPQSLVAADVNGDGKVDLITANHFPNTLAVLTNNGSGGFAPAFSPSLGTSPYCVAAADFNGDGKVDLVSANRDSSTLSVLLNVPTIWADGARLTGVLPAAGSTNYIQNQTASDQTAALRINGGASFTAGSVAIGKTNAATTLDVNGDARLDAKAAPYSEGLAVNFPADMSASGGYGGIHFHSTTRNGTFDASSIKWGMFYNYTAEGSIGGNGLSFVQNNTNTRLLLSTDGDVHWGKANVLSVNQSGSIELGDSTAAGNIPFIDFHYGFGSAQDYNVRIINDGTELLSILRFGSGTRMAQFSPAGLSVNGTFVSTSDRNAKENFKPVDSLDVLAKVAALPLSRWNYKEDKASEHIGPMAQDFYRAFSVGPDDKHIAVVDEGGVALAAIQALNQKLAEQKAENAALKARLDKLERLILEKK